MRPNAPPARSTFLILGLAQALLSTFVRAGIDQWTPVGPFAIQGGDVTALAIDSNSPSTIYAGTRGIPAGVYGIFKSVDAGVSWTTSRPINTPFKVFLASGELGVTALAIDPFSSSTIYAATLGEGVLKTTDGGTTWISSNEGLGSILVTALVIDPRSPATLYASSRSACVPQTSYSCTPNIGGVYRSDDSAHTWTLTNSVSPYGVRALAIDPMSPATLYAEAAGDLYKSVDRGATWLRQSGFPSVTINGFAIDPHTSSTLYAATNSNNQQAGVYKSVDGGVAWTAANNGLSPTTTVKALVVDPTSSATLYAMTNNGVAKSTDAGLTWLLTAPGFSGFALAVDPRMPSTVYAGTYGGGVYKSDNAGVAFSPTNSPLLPVLAQALAIGSNPPVLYMGAALGGGIFRSTDKGKTWIRSPFGAAQVFTLVAEPSNSMVVYAGTPAGVFKSIDGGNRWSRSSSGLNTPSTASLAIDPTAPSTLYAGTSGGGVYKSRDGGGTWTPANNGLLPTKLAASTISTIVIDALSPSTIYVGATNHSFQGDFGVYKSLDAGASWAAVNAGLTETQINALLVDPASPTTLYAAEGYPGLYQGVFKTVNGGESWTSFTPHGFGPVLALGIDPAPPWTMFMLPGAPGGLAGPIFSTTDGNTVIEPDSSDLEGKQCFSFAIDAAMSTLYVGTEVGVFELTLPRERAPAQRLRHGRVPRGVDFRR